MRMLHILTWITLLAIWTIGSTTAQQVRGVSGANQSTSTTNHTRTEIRVRNDSTVPFTNVVVGGRNFGDIKAGTASSPQTWPAAFPEVSVSLWAGGAYMIVPGPDFSIGLSLGPGYFTYVISIRKGRLSLSAENDEQAARVSAWLLSRKWSGDTWFFGVTDRNATLTFRQMGSRVRATLQYISGEPAARWEEECSVSVGHDGTIMLRGLSYRLVSGPPGTFSLDTLTLRLNDDGALTGTFLDDDSRYGGFRFTPAP